MIGDLLIVLITCLLIIIVSGWTIFPLPNTQYQYHAMPTPALQPNWQKPNWYQNWNQPPAKCVESSITSDVIAPSSIASPALPYIEPKIRSRLQVSVKSTDEYLTPTAVVKSPRYESTSEPF